MRVSFVFLASLYSSFHFHSPSHCPPVPLPVAVWMFVYRSLGRSFDRPTFPFPAPVRHVDFASLFVVLFVLSSHSAIVHVIVRATVCCVCVCVCLFSGLMCALDCAQIAQVQLKLSIQFLSSYCAIFKNLNSIFIIAVGPLVLSSRNIIANVIIRFIINFIIIFIIIISAIVVISCRIIIALTLAPYSFVRLAPRFISWPFGRLLQCLTFLSLFPIPRPSHSFVFAFPMPTSILHILGAILFHSQWRHSAGALTKWQWKQKWRQEKFESQVY